jgi:hypothetical protein
MLFGALLGRTLTPFPGRSITSPVTTGVAAVVH